MDFNKNFVTLFGIGSSTHYGGIVAIIVGVLLAHGVYFYFALETLATLMLAISIIATFEITKYINQNSHPSSIAIDKIAGVVLAVLIIEPTLLTIPKSIYLAIASLSIIASYQFFHIKKPSTIGWLSRNLKGGLGYIAASLLSGVASGFLTILILKLIQKSGVTFGM